MTAAALLAAAILMGGMTFFSFGFAPVLFKQLPMGFLMMIIVTVLLFSAVKQPLIIWLVVPFAIIGITAGLLARGAEPAQAAVWAAWLHGRAGERLAASVGRVGGAASGRRLRKYE